MDRRRALEAGTAAVSVLAVAAALATGGAPSWPWILGFAAFVILAENTSVVMHRGASASPCFMVVMAAVAILHDTGSPGLIAGLGLIGAAGGLYLPHIRSRSLGLLAFNCGQYSLASLAAGAVWVALDPSDGTGQLVGALTAALTFGAVNTGLVIPLVSLRQQERPLALWADMRPALPNYLTFGLLGLVVGLVGAELGILAIILLAIPMAIGRWTFTSFQHTKEAHEASISLFIRLIEAKDPYTAGHTDRVAKYAGYIAEELGVPPDRQEHLRQSALMHDIGKLAVPSRLLNKPGKLTPEEWEVVKRHNSAGIGILARVDFMRGMAVTASDKHGRFDHGDAGTPPELVLEAHVVAVADAFDAMTSTRSYRRALAQDVAFEELRRNAGTQFNPGCVEALITAIERRGECYGLGHEDSAHEFSTPPPVTGVGSAGLGDLAAEEAGG